MRHRLLPLFAFGLVTVALAGHDAAARQAADTPDAAREATAGPPASDEAVLRTAKIPTDGPGLIEFFRKRTVESADNGRLRKLVGQLGDDVFQVREQASAQLIAAGARAKPVLAEALRDPDLEVAYRARECLRRIEQGATAMLVSTAARVLAQHKPDGAAEVLLNYLPSAEDEAVAEEVRSALAALAVRDGRPDPVLVAALADKQPTLRAAAAVALSRGGAAGQTDAVRKLLGDPDPGVRLRVGLALAAGREKEALPVLIDLIGELPSQDTGSVEDLLYRLAGDKAPAGSDADLPSRRRFRDEWKKWWDAEGSKLDLTKLEEASKSLGYTLVLLLDQGKAMELDAANRPRWTVEGLEFPLDVQFIPDDRLLSAEYNGNHVTERDVKTGKVLWEYKIAHALAAQRLSNGNTFIASQTALVEVDRAGKVVWEYTPTGGETIMKAQKLRNGEVAMVTQLGVTRFVQLNRDGRTEKRAFAVNLHTSGGRIDVLPNGNVLVPENANNRVVELEPTGPVGRVVWEVTVDSPVAAVRLQNGHTMVTSMNPARGAVELDRSGKEVWTYKTDTRVTRALRR
jgi:HEAT repeat protein